MKHTTGPDPKSRAEPSGRRRETRVSLGAKCGRFPSPTATLDPMYRMLMTKTCLRRNRSGSNSGSSCHFYTYGSTRGFFPLVHALSLVRPFGDRRVPVRTARGATLGAGEQTAKATGTAVCGESYRLRPAKVTQPSLVGGRRRPCLCLVPPPDAPAHTGRAHVTLTFGSQVYYQYLVLAITMG